jgi:hypothetical protein
MEGITQAGVSESTARKVLFENAAKLYHLELPASAATA